LLVLFLLSSQSLLAWGPDGHRFVNRVAVEHVPQAMPAFFREAADRIEYNGPEPDEWRERTELALKNSQEPDHFIDLERVEGMQLPPTRYEFYKMLYEKRAQAPKEHADDLLPDHVGLQPYITMEVYGRLKVAFREYRALKGAGKPTAPAEQNAVFYAGWLGHYVADAANPMHTTIYYNGWVGDNPEGFTTRKTVHADFESKFVHANVQPADFTKMVHDAEMLSDPWAAYMAYIRDSNALVKPLYRLDKQNAFADKGTPEGREFVNKRLAAGAQMLVNLWWTAWEESAKPVPRFEDRPTPASAPKATAPGAGN
jgi:hypothetical protein